MASSSLRRIMAFISRLSLADTLSSERTRPRPSQYGHGFCRASAGYLHQPELGYAQDVGLGPIALEMFLERLQDLAPVALTVHVDEVGDDDAADVPEAELPGNLAGGLEVGPEDRVGQVSRPDVLAGVHVYGREGLCMVYHQVAAALQPDPAADGLLYLGF